MNAFRRILWKEFRATWVLWVGAGVATVALFVLLRLGAQYHGDALPVMRSFALWIPPLVAMGALSAWFAGEREDGTADWLVALSVPPGPVLAARIGLAWISALALQVILIGTAVAIGSPTWGQNFAFATGDEHWASYFASVLYLSVASVAWSLLCSLLCRKPVTAMVAASACLICVETLLAHDHREVGFAAFWQHAEPPVTLWRVLLTLAVLAFDVWLGARWLRGERLSLDKFRQVAMTDWSLGGWRQLAELTMPWQRAARRLLWLEVRRCSATGAWFAVSLAGMVFAVFWLPDQITIVAALITLVAAAGCGLGSFIAEFSTPGLNFWRNRSVATAGLWCIKQAVWLLWMSLWAVVLIAVAMGVEAVMGGSGRLNSFSNLWPDLNRGGVTYQTAFVHIAGSLLTAFAVGQLATVLTRRSVPAVFVAFFGVVFLTVAHVVLAHLRITPWLAVAPIVVWLFAFSAWLWQRRIAERADWRGRFLMAGWLTVPPLAIWAVALTYWVESIPDVRPRYKDQIAALTTPLTAQERQTRDDLVKAGAAIVRVNDDQQSHPRALLSSMTDEVVDKAVLRQTVESNAAVLQTARELSRRHVSGLALPTEDYTAGTEAPVRHLNVAVSELTALLCLSAAELTDQQKFDAAFEDYLAALRLGQMYARRGPVFSRWTSGTVHLAQPVLRGMANWANHPQQTSTRIAEALPRLQLESGNGPSLDDALIADYLVEEAFFGPSNQLSRVFEGLLFGAHERHARLRACALDNRLLWVKNVASGHWQASRAVEDYVPTARQTGAMRVRDDHYRDHPIGLEDYSTTWIWQRETRLNGTLLVMAALAYRHERGRTPTDLDDLAAYFPNGLPLDPYTGGYFQYKPRGFPFLAQEKREELQRLADVPVIWSAGPNGGSVRPPEEKGPHSSMSLRGWLPNVAFVIPPAPETEATALVPRWSELEQLASAWARRAGSVSDRSSLHARRAPGADAPGSPRLRGEP